MTLQDLGFTNPVPLILITVVLGFILGWLVTGLPRRSKISHFESQVLDLNTKLNESGKKELELQAALSAASADLDKANAKADSLRQELATRDAELTDLKLQEAALRNASQQSYGALNSQLESQQAELERVCAENENLKINLEGTARDLSKARADLETVQEAVDSKDTALTEAYARAVRLEHETSDEQAQLLSAQAEIAALRRNVSTLSAVNQELAARLDRARGEVAGELASLTSTMLRVKDEELADANTTIAALQAQMAERPVTS
jgi:chromosome segregation ATPase